MWIPARLTVPPGRTRRRATGTTRRPERTPPAVDDDCRRGLGLGADPRSTELARELPVTFAPGEDQQLRSPSGAAPATPGARRHRIRATRPVHQAAPRRAGARGTRSRPRRQRRASSRRGRPAELHTNASGTVIASAYPPSTVHPVNSARSHRFSSPRRQNAHRPHVRCSQVTPTRSPPTSTAPGRGRGRPPRPRPGARVHRQTTKRESHLRPREGRCGSSRTP